MAGCDSGGKMSSGFHLSLESVKLAPGNRRPNHDSMLCDPLCTLTHHLPWAE